MGDRFIDVKVMSRASRSSGEITRQSPTMFRKGLVGVARLDGRVTCERTIESSPT